MGQVNKNALHTSESNKGTLCSSQNKDSKFLSKFDLEVDFHEHVNKNSNPFPIKVFPKILQEVIFEASDKLQFNADFLGGGMLSAFSAAIGNLYQLKMQETWIAKANLYTVIVGRTGDSKSHAIDFCFRPIKAYDKKRFSDYELELNEYKSSQEAINKPQLSKKIVVDFTPEALVKVHKFNSQGITIYSDEILSWINNIGRYSNSGELQTYLTLWSGKSITIDRVSSESILLDDPFINVIGSTQKTLLKELSKGDKSLNGFCERLLFVYPNNLKDIKWNDNKISSRIVDSYSKLVGSILDKEFISPKLIEFSVSARNTLIKWQNSLNRGCLFDYERQISVKLEEYVLRFCLILEVINATTKQEEVHQINKNTVLDAIQLYEYFYNTAITVKEEIYSKSYYDNLTKLQKAIYKELPNKEFTTKDGIQIACREQNHLKRTSERSFKRFLKDNRLFERIDHGVYKKVISV